MIRCDNRIGSAHICNQEACYFYKIKKLIFDKSFKDRHHATARCYFCHIAMNRANPLVERISREEFVEFRKLVEIESVMES